MHEVKIVRQPRQAEKQEQARQMRQQMTPAESVLWERLRRSQWHGLHFRRQQVIGGFIADFYCRAARLVVEADGGIHQQQEAYDRERDALLAAHHLRILRFSNTRILHDTEAVLQEIAQFAGQSPAPSSSPSLPPSLTGKGVAPQGAGG